MTSEKKQKLDLDSIEARAKAATPGPWKPRCDYQFDLKWLCNDKDGASVVGNIRPDDEGNPDRDFDIVADFSVWREASERHPFEHTIEPKAKAQVAANIDHIAGLSPDVALALVEEVRRLRKALGGVAPYAALWVDDMRDEFERSGNVGGEEFMERWRTRKAEVEAAEFHISVARAALGERP